MGKHGKPIHPKRRKTPMSNHGGRFTGGGRYFILFGLAFVAVMVAWVYLAIR